MIAIFMGPLQHIFVRLDSGICALYLFLWKTLFGWVLLRLPVRLSWILNVWACILTTFSYPRSQNTLLCFRCSKIRDLTSDLLQQNESKRC